MNIGTLTLANFEDSEIIENFTQGNIEKATTVFVRKYQNFVFATAFRYLSSYEDAEDITQEVFIKALKHIKNFRGESSLKTWLYKITVNLSINALRKKKLKSFFRLGDENNNFENTLIDSSDPESIFNSNEFEQRFNQILNTLPEKQRETFVLRFYENMSYEEMSKILGTSIGGLKANYHQAVKKLGIILKDDVNIFRGKYE